MPSVAARSGRTSSSSRRLPRSLPYDVEFSLTRNSSRTPWLASQRASARISGGRRDTNAPRNDGMAQNEQRRSQPDAIFSGATTPADSRRRNTPPLGPVHGAAGSTMVAGDPRLVGVAGLVVAGLGAGLVAGAGLVVDAAR